jgi:hypothetical protein
MIQPSQVNRQARKGGKARAVDFGGVRDRPVGAARAIIFPGRTFNPPIGIRLALVAGFAVKDRDEPEYFTTEAQRARRHAFMSGPEMPSETHFISNHGAVWSRTPKAMLFFLGVLSASAVKLKRLGGGRHSGFRYRIAPRRITEEAAMRMHTRWRLDSSDRSPARRGPEGMPVLFAQRAEVEEYARPEVDEWGDRILVIPVTVGHA